MTTDLERCFECGHRIVDHSHSRCPRGLSIEITAATLERAQQTGHPRLLSNVLRGKCEKGVFQGVTIERIEVAQ